MTLLPIPTSAIRQRPCGEEIPGGWCQVVCVRADRLPIAFVRVLAFVQLPETSVAAQLGSLPGKHSTAAIGATFVLSVRAE